MDKTWAEMREEEILSKILEKTPEEVKEAQEAQKSAKSSLILSIVSLVIAILTLAVKLL
ncbi:MAG: hypothetical protein KH230_16890 [Enterocloster asparagiformis]|nr:hypothetical protein [Enterocloster asparagiformis]